MDLLNRFLFKAALVSTLLLNVPNLEAQTHPAVDKEILREWYSWVLLPSMKEVRSSVQKTLIGKLKLEPEYVKTVPIGRIFTSEWYQVMVDNKVYVIDQHAKYWLLVDGEVNFFMFENGVQSVNQSNKSRDALLTLRPLLNAMNETVVTYPSMKAGERKLIYVFMDVSCPHSKAFHLTKRQNMQLEGFEFRYLPFSARKKNRQLEKLQQVAWCAPSQEEKQMWLDKIYTSPKADDVYYALGQKGIDNQTCSTGQLRSLKTFDTVIENHQLAGTPVFMNESGVIFYGYDAFLRGNKGG